MGSARQANGWGWKEAAFQEGLSADLDFDGQFHGKDGMEDPVKPHPGEHWTEGITASRGESLRARGQCVPARTATVSFVEASISGHAFQSGRAASLALPENGLLDREKRKERQNDDLDQQEGRVREHTSAMFTMGRAGVGVKGDGHGRETGVPQR